MKNGMQATAGRGGTLFSTFVIFFLLFVVGAESSWAYIDGSLLIGRSGGPPRNRDCTGCHNAGAAIPQVALSGPASVAAGSINTYTLTITGVGTTSGIAISTSGGTLVATDPGTLITTSGELSHVAPVPLAGSVTYTFDLTAPATGTATLYAAGLAGDGDGTEAGDGTATASLAIAVAGGGAPPNPGGGGLTAVISGPATGPEGIDLAYDGGSSTVTGATIVSYDWDFGDGTTGVGVSVTHIFTAGNYIVSLLVTDDTGATNTAQLDVAITPPGINASPGATLYDVNCLECHGPAGAGGPDGPPINNPPASVSFIADKIATVPVMQPLETVLTEDDIEEIAAYLESPTVATVGANRFARSKRPAPRGVRIDDRTNIRSLNHGNRTRVDRGSLDWIFVLLFGVWGWRKVGRRLA